MLHLGSSWLFANEPVLVNDVVTIIITALVVLVAWTLLMSFASKLLRGEGNMRAFWVLGCLVLGLLEIATLLLALVRFNLQRVELGGLLSTLTYCAIAVLLLGWCVDVCHSYATPFKMGFFGLAGVDHRWPVPQRRMAKT